jgi:hypothetical protein
MIRQPRGCVIHHSYLVRIEHFQHCVGGCYASPVGAVLQYFKHRFKHCFIGSNDHIYCRIHATGGSPAARLCAYQIQKQKYHLLPYWRCTTTCSDVPPLGL